MKLTFLNGEYDFADPPRLPAPASPGYESYYKIGEVCHRQYSPYYDLLIREDGNLFAQWDSGYACLEITDTKDWFLVAPKELTRFTDPMLVDIAPVKEEEN